MVRMRSGSCELIGVCSTNPVQVIYFSVLGRDEARKRASKQCWGTTRRLGVYKNLLISSLLQHNNQFTDYDPWPERVGWG
jgi:hypothetical protein